MSTNRQLVAFVGGALAVGAVLHWLYTRNADRAMKDEAHGAALREMLPLKEFVAATLEDPVQAAAFKRHVALVRHSWNRLKPNRLELTAHVMYQKLRQEDPSTQEVFDAQLDWASQERIFTVMIGNLLARLDDASIGSLLETLTRLGKRHHELGVRPQQYSSMQRAILTSLEELLGDEWNNEYSEAWATVFSFISRVMVLAAHEPVDPAAKTAEDTAASEKSLGGGCPIYVNKYLTVARDPVSTEGHMLQHRMHAGASNKIAEES